MAQLHLFSERTKRRKLPLSSTLQLLCKINFTSKEKKKYGHISWEVNYFVQLPGRDETVNNMLNTNVAARFRLMKDKNLFESAGVNKS